MTTATEIAQKFASFYEGNDDEVSLKEMKEKLSEFFKKEKPATKKKAAKDEEKPAKETKKKVTKKSDDEEDKPEKKKREPSAYNVFMKEQMAILKEENAKLSAEERPSAKDNMKKIAELWQQKKSEN